jgi:NADH-quinone oxidoreductase subunit L
MLFVVFHGASTPLSHQPDIDIKRSKNEIPVGERSRTEPLPQVMTLTLIPLALLGLLGGFLNLPAYLTEQGFLSGFLSSIGGFASAAHGSHRTEIMLQIGAATACIIGLGLAWSRYTGDRRAASLATECGDAPAYIRFLQSGWMLDDLYRILIIRPFVRLGHFLWKSIDLAVIDGSLDGLARTSGRLGQFPAAWCTGRVATSLFALAGGICAMLGFLAWTVLT